MPFYLFQNPKTGEVKEVFQKMTDNHVFSSEGLKWVRLFTLPQASFDTKFDPFSKKDFVKNTTNKKEKIGDIWDRSKEASLKRQDKDGVDLVKENHYKKWSEERKGRIHPDVIKENQQKTIEI